MKIGKCNFYCVWSKKLGKTKCRTIRNSRVVIVVLVAHNSYNWSFSTFYCCKFLERNTKTSMKRLIEKEEEKNSYLLLGIDH